MASPCDPYHTLHCSVHGALSNIRRNFLKISFLKNIDSRCQPYSILLAALYYTVVFMHGEKLPTEPLLISISKQDLVIFSFM